MAEGGLRRLLILTILDPALLGRIIRIIIIKKVGVDANL